MSNTNRFDGKGEVYAKARPKYASALFDDMKSTLNVGSNAVFADIGSGTGIFTEQLLDHGCTVFAVEPNEDMRRIAEEKLNGREGFHSVDGMDKNTKLPNNSVDFVTVAQAFHWFDIPAFKKECQRILKPGGKVILVYNSRKPDAACTKELAVLLKEFVPAFHGFSNGVNDEVCRGFFDNGCDIFKYDNSLVYDRQGFIDRCLSSSYSLKEGDERYVEYMDGIHKLFERFAVNGEITVPNYTVAYIG